MKCYSLYHCNSSVSYFIVQTCSSVMKTAQLNDHELELLDTAAADSLTGTLQNRCKLHCWCSVLGPFVCACDDILNVKYTSTPVQMTHSVCCGQYQDIVRFAWSL